MYIYIGMGRPPQPQEQPAGHRGDPIQVESLFTHCISLSLSFSLPLCRLPLPSPSLAQSCDPIQLQ